MRKILVLIFLIFVSSCGSMPKDNSMSPVDAGLYLLELHSSCGMDSGLHGCHYNQDTNLSEKTFSFPVAFKGEYEVVSQRCNFSLKQSFKGESFISFTWAQLLKEKAPDALACLFSVRVKIDGVRSIMGQFLLENSEEFKSANIGFMGKDYEGVASYQLPSDASLSNLVTIKDVSSIDYEGCGVSGNEPSGQVSIGKLFPERKSCLVALAGYGQENHLGTFNLKFYDSKYSNLPMPKISYNGKKLSVEADSIVGIVSINNKWKKSNKMSLSVKKGQLAWVRILTSNGRFLVLGIKDGEVVWTPSNK